MPITWSYGKKVKWRDAWCVTLSLSMILFFCTWLYRLCVRPCGTAQTCHLDGLAKRSDITVTVYYRVRPLFVLELLGKLQRLQNAAARLVCTVSRYDHITPSLINLHWLPITHRIEFKIAMLVHICIYVRRRTTASFSLDLIKIKESSKYVAPKVWNRHPLEIRQCQSLNTFKVLLKTHLLKLAFY